MPSPDREQIKCFVQETLGCRCPDAVMEHFEIERNILTDCGVYLHSRINIGGRLLIYVIDQKRSSFSPEDLPGIVHEGIHERYKYGFNRFRLVLATEEPWDSHKAVETMFDKLQDKDDKIHLHIIDKEELTF